MQNCSGPCLRSECFTCPRNVVLFSQISFVYTFACLFYIVVTRFMDTPFNDSLTSAQKDLKNASSKKRGFVFLAGVFLSCLLLFVSDPFSKVRVS